MWSSKFLNTCRPSGTQKYPAAFIGLKSNAIKCRRSATEEGPTSRLASRACICEYEFNNALVVASN